MAWYDVAARNPTGGQRGDWNTQIGARPWYAFAGGDVGQGWATSGLASPSVGQALLFDTNPDLVDRQVAGWLAPGATSQFRRYIEAMQPGLRRDWAIESGRQYDLWQNNRAGVAGPTSGRQDEFYAPPQDPGGAGWGAGSQEQPNVSQGTWPGYTYRQFMGERYGDLLAGFGRLSASARGENPLAFGNGVAGRTVFR